MPFLRSLVLASCVSALALAGCDSDGGSDESNAGSAADPRCEGDGASQTCCSAEGAWTCSAVDSCADRALLHAACGFEVSEDWQSSCDYWEDRVANGNICEDECYSASLACMLATAASCEDPADKRAACQALQDDEACQFDNCGGGSTG